MQRREHDCNENIPLTFNALHHSEDYARLPKITDSHGHRIKAVHGDKFTCDLDNGTLPSVHILLLER